MAMADQFVNDDTGTRLSDDFDKNLENVLFQQGQDYADRNKRSRNENKGRAESRAKIKELGMNPNAYATAIRLIKDLTPAELSDWKRDFELTLKVMGSRQKELFPEEQLKAEARIQRAAEKAAGKARTKEELDAKTDSDPKSDPANGGAQVDLEDAIKSVTDKEAAEGEKVLDQAPTNKKSQSAKAAEARQAAGTDRDF